MKLFALLLSVAVVLTIVGLFMADNARKDWEKVNSKRTQSMQEVLKETAR